jgi:hypothetical protein
VIPKIAKLGETILSTEWSREVIASIQLLQEVLPDMDKPRDVPHNMKQSQENLRKI